MSNATQHTVQVDQAIEIRNEAIRAINKIAGERHALWNDYLATVRNYDAAVAERDALAKQVSELRAALKLCVARLDEYEDAKDGIALECANVALERSASLT